MDAGLFNVFHDRANDRVLAVGDTVDIHLGGVLEEPVEQDGATRGDLGALVHVVAHLLLRVDDTHGPAAEDKGRAEKKRKPNLLGDGDGFLSVGGGAVGWLAEAEFVEKC